MSDLGLPGDQPLVEPLTDRELEILSHLAENRSNREIADALVLSLNTVKWYARQIYGKLGVGDRHQAVLRARELGLLGIATQPRHNLPAHLTPFLGRRESVALISQQLLEPTTRLLTIVGPGGIGKTRLAHQVATVLLEDHPDGFLDGVLIVALAPLSSSASLAPALAQAVGLRFYQGPEGPEQQLVGYLHQKRMLLVLDNFEQLVDQQGIRLLTQILEAAPGVRMLVTSRTRLNVQGEHVYPLGGMAVPAVDAVAQWEQPVERAETYGGIQLFLHAARRVRPNLQLGPDNMVPVAEICESVQGMPLGIELAAAWAAVLEPDEIARELERSLDILVTHAGNVPERQRSMRAVFDTSWDLLTEEEQMAVQQISVFCGGFGRKGAERAVQVSLNALLALVNKSWVQRDGEGRYQVHDLLRRYGEERLGRDPALESAVRHRHSEYYCDWVSEQEARLTGAEQQAAIAALMGDVENVLAACRWAASQGQLEWLGEAISALGMFYYRGPGGYQAGEIAFADMEATLDTTRGERSPAFARAQRVTARIRMWRSTFNALLGDIEKAKHLARESLAQLDTPPLAGEDTRAERAHIALQMGYNQFDADSEAARQHFSRCYELYSALDNRWGMAIALLSVGRAARDLGALGEAEDALTRSVALHRKIGDQVGLGKALATLGGLVVSQRRFEEGERLIRESLALTMETDRYGISFGLGFLGGFAQLATGRFAEAEASLRECIAICKELGMQVNVIKWGIRLAQAYLHQGKYQAARAQAEQILSLARELGYSGGASFGVALLGEVALAEGDFAAAQRHLEESARIVAEGTSGDPARLLAWLGLAARGLDRRTEARQHLTGALQWAGEAQQLIELLVGLAGVALLESDEGEPEQAIELYALASSFPFVSNSRWFEDVAGRHIAAISAGLPSEAVAAAQERGRSRDLDATALELSVGAG